MNFFFELIEAVVVKLFNQQLCLKFLPLVFPFFNFELPLENCWHSVLEKVLKSYPNQLLRGLSQGFDTCSESY